MDRSTLLLIILSTAYVHARDQALDQEWGQFKSLHGKTYADLQEDVYRRDVWEKNIGDVARHNLGEDLGLHTHRLGVNHLTDMTLAEYHKAMLEPVKVSLDNTLRYQVPGQDVPESVDWRTAGWVTPVQNQGQCASDDVINAVGALESQHARFTGDLLPLSQQQVIDCFTHTCQGHLASDIFGYIAKQGGLDTLACYPRSGSPGTCHFNTSCVGATCSGGINVAPDENSLKQAVGSIGPVAVLVDASHVSFQMYQSGIYPDPDCSPENLDHSLLVVGYSNQDGQDYWICRNSWGTSWGMEGYILIARNKDNMCGIASSAGYPIGVQ